MQLKVPEAPNLSVRIIREIAHPLLESREIRQALGQVRLTQEDMDAVLSDHVGDLFCSPASDDWTFTESIGWERMLPWVPSPWLAPVALIVLGILVLGLIDSIGLAHALGVLLALAYLVVLGVVGLGRWLRDPPAPTALTADSLRRRIIGPFLREYLNRLLDEQDRPVELRVTTAPGLAELSDREQIVPTDASARLIQLSRAMPTGSLGISGPRGAGKTTLLRSFCDATLEWLDTSRGSGRPDLRLMVSAPVDYDAREFILHLFGRLCETVLATRRVSRDERGRAETRRHAAVALPGLLLAAAGAVTIAWVLLDPRRRLPHLTPSDLVLAGGIIALAAGLVLLAAGEGARSRRGAQPSVPDEARTWLTRLRYLQAFTTGYSGTLRLPAGAQMEASTTRQLTELQLALPDLVDRYRDFAARTAQWYRASWRGPSETAGRLVIGIDELDKIGTADACERFLNDIKAIFGIPHCLYLVSVSDDALTAFEQRAVVARTAFDNAFDEIVRAGYLDFEAASSLLHSRVAGLPRPMIALCHVLSGGLPRDLIRAVRSMIDACAADGSHITALCKAMITAEVGVLKASCLAGLAAEPDRLDRTGLLPLLLDRSWPGVSAAALQRALDRDLRHADTPRNFCAAIYFYATVAEIFGSGLAATVDALRARDARRGPALGPGDEANVDRLAHARNALSGNPDVAWELITRFRAARELVQPVRPWTGPSGQGRLDRAGPAA